MIHVVWFGTTDDVGANVPVWSLGIVAGDCESGCGGTDCNGAKVSVSSDRLSCTGLDWSVSSERLCWDWSVKSISVKPELRNENSGYQLYNYSGTCI